MKRNNNSGKTMSFAYGIHSVLEALRSGKQIEKILLRKALKGDNISIITEECRKRKIPIQEVPAEKLNRITGKQHQGVIAFLGIIEYQEIENIVPVLFEEGKMPLLVILDRVTDVRNFGAICRTAVCAGAHAVIVPSRGNAQVNEDAIKASAGAIHRVNICRSYNLKNTIRFLKDSGISIVGITEKTDRVIYDVELSAPVALILGSEEDGISPEYLKLCDAVVKIPMYGPVESLNVSVAAAVVMYETVRQRREYVS